MRMRAGRPFMLVGPQRISSWRCRSRASPTGRSSQALWVRAFRNSWSRVASLRGSAMAAPGAQLLPRL
ncbi:MAG: hypothetical protein ER33_10505 [Cyanobium sp. CACIAM 14]|nr:MAG: hypothetical protein ER33_10505 [Cyanobium sp. CACIAM 14]